MRALTERQAQMLAVLNGGYIALAPGKRDWQPFLRRGLVEVLPKFKDDPGGRGFLPPLRITTAGVRAVADAIDAGLLPLADMKPVTVVEQKPRRYTLKVCAACLCPVRDSWHRCEAGGKDVDQIEVNVHLTRAGLRRLDVAAALAGAGD